MFYTNRVLFVHQPRTGGTWLTEWARQNLACSIDLHYLKHLSRREMVAKIPELEGLQAFTIVRDEETRFQSFLRHCRAFDIANWPQDFTAVWRQIVTDAAILDEVEFRRNYWQPAEYYADPAVQQFDWMPGLAGCIRWLRKMHR